MSLEDCFKRGLLRKTGTDESKVRNSIRMSRHFLGRAEGNLENGYYDVAFLMAYNSMFHSARALLFTAGYKERSHYCLIALLKRNYGKKKELTEILSSLDSYRISRHSIQYSGEGCSREDAEESIDDAGNLLILVEKELKP